MHELGIVFHTIESVNKIAKENNVSKINSVTVQIGEVSLVVPELYENCWNWAVKKETILKDAKIIMETIPAVTFCENCEKTYPTVQYAKICPYCKSDRTYLQTGNEFIIKEIEAENG